MVQISAYELEQTRTQLSADLEELKDRVKIKDNEIEKLKTEISNLKTLAEIEALKTKLAHLKYWYHKKIQNVKQKKVVLLAVFATSGFVILFATGATYSSAKMTIAMTTIVQFF